MSSDQKGYYIPAPSHWPLLAAIGLPLMLGGAANWLHDKWFGPHMFVAGALVITVMFFGWFGIVIRENQKGLYDKQEDLTFRWAMLWFIFTEVCFFATFFGALFYSRIVTVPSLGGEYANMFTHYLLWPNFKNIWPTLVNPDSSQFLGPKSVMYTWGIPALNTLILLTSGATITWAHWALKLQKRKQLIIGLGITVLLGWWFLYMQGHEYIEAYVEHGLRLDSGIYGTTFFMLTGFHGLHVTLGTIMLLVIWLRCLRGHFTPNNHFAFEAVAWYWHFVDVVWLFLFIFVYWL